uniref:Leukemia inhibitory factor n=1 Tax=Pelusios castaneus TaxID=367368 RepID=A0A8C8RE36_9SAUR
CALRVSSAGQRTASSTQSVFSVAACIASLCFSFQLHHQGFVHDLDQHCYKPVEWFPAGNIMAQPRVLMLQELNRTMARMVAALHHIKKQQETLNKPDAKLLGELQSASGAVRGMLSNIHCALCLLGTVTSPTADIPERPPIMRAFQHKIEGCKVLWNYKVIVTAF